MDVSNQVRIRTVQISFDADSAPSKSVDDTDAIITETVQASYKEGFRVVSMTSLASEGTTYAVVIAFERHDHFEHDK